MLMGIEMTVKSKIATLCAAFVSAAFLTACDITPISPVLAGDTGDSSNEAIGTVLPDPPRERPPSGEPHDKKKAQPDAAGHKPEGAPAHEKGKE